MTSSWIIRMRTFATENLKLLLLAAGLTIGSVIWATATSFANSCSPEAKPRVAAARLALYENDMATASAIASDAVAIYPNLPCTHEAKAAVEAHKMTQARNLGDLGQAETHRHACAFHAETADRFLGTLPETEALIEFCDASKARLSSNPTQGEQCAPQEPAPQQSKANQTVASQDVAIDWAPSQSRKSERDTAKKPKPRAVKPQLSCRPAGR
jgi:hypothetical protein